MFDVISSILLVMPEWEHFEHKGDIGIQGKGSTAEEAFEMAALAMTAVITKPELIDLKETVLVNCSAPDLELLLVEWLNAVLYQMDVKKMLFGKFKVKIEGENLTGDCIGEPISTDKHQPAVEVKAATYCQLKVEKLPDGTWIARCVVDV